MISMNFDINDHIDEVKKEVFECVNMHQAQYWPQYKVQTACYKHFIIDIYDLYHIIFGTLCVRQKGQYSIALK